MRRNLKADKWLKNKRGPSFSLMNGSSWMRKHKSIYLRVVVLNYFASIYIKPYFSLTFCLIINFDPSALICMGICYLSQQKNERAHVCIMCIFIESLFKKVFDVSR